MYQAFRVPPPCLSNAAHKHYVVNPSGCSMLVQHRAILRVQGQEHQQQRQACKEPAIRGSERREPCWCCDWLPVSLEDCLTSTTHEHALSTLEQVVALKAGLAMHCSNKYLPTFCRALVYNLCNVQWGMSGLKPEG